MNPPYPDVILGDISGLYHPPGVYRDLHRFCWQEIPSRFPPEEFLATDRRCLGNSVRLSPCVQSTALYRLHLSSSKGAMKPSRFENHLMNIMLNPRRYSMEVNHNILIDLQRKTKSDLLWKICTGSLGQCIGSCQSQAASDLKGQQADQ